MKVDKLLKKYLGCVDVAFYENKKLIASTTTKDLYSNYPLDMKNYFLLNSKVKSYRVVTVADRIVFQVNIKSSLKLKKE